jgi:antitoxin ParD1/3/4
VRFLSESEVVAEALSEFQGYEEIRWAKLAELKAKIQVGIDELERGETAEFSLKEFLAARHAEHAAQ